MVGIDKEARAQLLQRMQEGNSTDPNRVVLPPATIKVGVFDFKVIMVKDDSLSKEGSLGETSFNDLTIKVDSNTPLRRCQAILLHEVLHSVVFMYRNDSESETPELNERQINSLTFGLLQVVRDNPQLVDFLREYSERAK